MHLRAPLRAPRQCPAQRLPVLARRGSEWAFHGTRLNTRLPLTGKKPNAGTKSGKYAAFFDTSMTPLGCAPYPQTRRHPRTAGGADAPHLCTSKRYDPKADELLLGTDAVDVVVKAIVARAGQIAAATENSIAEPARQGRRRARARHCSDVRKSRNTMSKAGPLNRKITANKSFGARWKRAAAKCTAIRSPRRPARASCPALPVRARGRS